MSGARVNTILVALCVLACASCSPFAAEEESFDEGTRFPALSFDGYMDKNRDGKLTADEYGALSAVDVTAAYADAELLLVHVAFEWCKYCWSETTEQIEWTKHFKGRFVSLQVMVETRDGREGERPLLDRWTTEHASMMPTVIEPAGKLFARFGRNATYILVEPKSSMRILAVGAGPPQFAAVRDVISKRLGPLPSASLHPTSP